jgi:two-component system cell cycle sensor histidine kinase/response regulator CckA
VINARDAMPDGGKITLRTAAIAVSTPLEGTPDRVPPGSYIALSIADTGKGIDPAVIPHIFEPFFTTKEEGKGTGLGLATVYGIVKQNHGFIHVASEKDDGTSFTLYLPRQAGEIRQPEPAEPKREAVPKGTETLLLVEDEANVSSVLAELLTEQGYQVLIAADGEEALTLFRQHADKVHLVISDIHMPGINGYEFARRLKTLSPQTKIILISGNAEDRASKDRDDTLIAALLPKPFSSQTLTRTIRTVLTEKANQAH